MLPLTLSLMKFSGFSELAFEYYLTKCSALHKIEMGRTFKHNVPVSHWLSTTLFDLPSVFYCIYSRSGESVCYKPVHFADAVILIFLSLLINRLMNQLNKQQIYQSTDL